MRTKSNSSKSLQTTKARTRSKRSDTFRVFGTILQSDGTSISNYLVRAFDQDCNLFQPLGEAVTNEAGQYEIRFTREQAGSREKANPDILIKVLDRMGRELEASTVFFNAPKETKIDLVLQTPAAPKLSEYESINTALKPLLQSRQLADLTESDINSLAAESGIAEKRIQYMVKAAILERQTGISANLFYGFARTRQPLDLERLFTKENAVLLKSLQDAIARNIIPFESSESLNTIFERLMQLKPKYVPLKDFAALANLELPDKVVNILKRHNIRTLVDILHSGGISQVKGLPPEDPAVKTLEAHARLSLLPTDITVNTQLMERGFASLTEIAESPRETFIATVREHVSEDIAVLVHETANVQTRYLGSVLADLRISAANGEARTISAPLSSALQAACGCNDCESAISPMAYLFDLLDYAVRHLKYQGSPVTLSLLENHFHQPFRDLPLTCEQMEKRVRQARICIEVLRKHIPAQYANYTPSWYLETAYTRLLEQIGTSFDEMRRIPTLKYPERLAFANRLGIFIDPLQPNRPDILDELLIDPTNQAQLTESTLEQVFGLRSTARDPLAPDVDDASYLVARLMYLRHIKWWQEDWPDSPPTDASPLIDPDIIGPADMLYTVLTPPNQRGRTANTPIHFWEDRQQQIQDWYDQIREAREHPQAGFESLITGKAVINGRPVQLNIGLGITMQQFDMLRDRRLKGEDLVPDLDQLRISVAAFDFLVVIWEALSLNPPGTVLTSEWEEVYDILIQRLKRNNFVVWRNQEKALGFTLSPEYFKLRASPLAGGVEWSPKPWRSTVEVRQNWEDRLRGRIDQEKAVFDGVQSAVNAVEDALLVELRNELIRKWALPGLITLDKLAALTQRLQIDCQAGVCQMTTRIAQAIETIQGVLFMARHGLLEGGAYTLDAPRFDEEWQWIGSYTAWQAAMQVFLYPENALRPILRREKSKVFQKLITDLQLKVPVRPEDAQKAADQYTEYFNDVCTLTPVAVYETGNWPNANSVAGSVSRDCLVIARGSSGKLYFAAFDQRPAWYLSFVPGHTMWEVIEGLPPNSEVIGILPYQPKLDEVHIALYARHRQKDLQTLYFTSYDGSGWKAPQQITELPALVTTAEYRGGVIPADSTLVAAGINGWRLRGDDRLIPIYVEGFGSLNRTALMVVTAQIDSNGKRRVGLLRGRDGGLVLTAFTTIDGQWNLPTPKPILLWRGGIQRVVLTRQDGALTQLGLLGTNWPQDNTLALIWQTNDGFVRAPDGTAWKVNANAPLVSAELDNGLFTSLLAIEYESTTDQFGWRDQSTRTFILRSNGQGLQLQTQFLLNNPNHEGTNMCSSVTHVAARRFVPARFTSFETLFVLGMHGHHYVRQGCTGSLMADIFAWEVIWNSQSARLVSRATVPETNAYNPNIKLEAENDFLAIQLPNGNEGVLLLPSFVPQGTSRKNLAAIAYTNDNRLRVTWQTTGEAIDPVMSSAIGAWSIRLDDHFLTLGLDGKRQLMAARADGSEFGGLDVLDNTGKLGLRWRISKRVLIPGGTSRQGWHLDPNAHYTGLDLDKDGFQEILAMAPDGRLGVLHPITSESSEQDASLDLRSVGLVNVAEREIVDRNSQRWLADRKMQIESAYSLNESPSLRRYLDEAYFFVPMQIALRLRESGYYTAALDWLRSLYDYERPNAECKIAYRLVIDEHPDEPEVVFQRDPIWLTDPMNPHAIAETRKYSYTKFTILNIVRCLLDFADAEFTQATSESVPRARELYLEALELLNLPEIRQHLTGCSERIGELTLEIGEDEYVWVWKDILNRLSKVENALTLASTVERIKLVIATNEPLPDRLATAQKVVAEAQPAPSAKTYATLAPPNRTARQRTEIALLADPAVTHTALRLGNLTVGSNELPSITGYWKKTPAPLFGFCVPPNRVIQATRSHAEMNLNKIRTCRNIAGLNMQLDPYAMPTATEASLQNLGSSDRLPSFQRPILQPLPYRYSVLIERAKQLVQLAQQMESSMLNSLQSLGQTQYDVLKARQDLILTQAGVRLKDLQLVEANDGISSAELQRDRAQLQSNHYRRLITQGLSVSEGAALGAMTIAVAAEFAGIYSPETFLEWFGAAAPAFGRLAELSSTVASYERRIEEWRLQQDLATQDVRIGQQQIQLAYDRARISAQDRAIAALQVDHAEAMLEFINTQKFGNEALYEWMSGILEQVYRFFLQQATSMAQLAEAQLAFERQEIPPAFIQADYWEPPANTNPPNISGTNAQMPNVRGLTGSARLLRDIYELDQYAFQTNQRKLQLAETISLAQLDPIAFQRFRETGILPFATTISLFDRKFPGHYLRLIRRVRTSVIALIPPTQGIRATLATTGTSRVVIGGTPFQKVRIQRGPESVALTAPINATGLFDLDTQPEMLVPFEGIGVDTTWEFRLAKPANQIDYNTIADVLITIDYTALNSSDYLQQVLQQMDPRFQADRPFSFRRDFADAWYDLHNPELLEEAQQMVVRFRTEREDFPPNLEDLSIQHVVLYFANQDGTKVPIENVNLQYTPDIPDAAGNRNTVGGDAKPIDGKISTRANAWNSLLGQLLPGEWVISLRPADNDPQKTQKLEKIKEWFKSEKGAKCEDILFVITYSGRMPEWPA